MQSKRRNNSVIGIEMETRTCRGPNCNRTFKVASDSVQFTCSNICAAENNFAWKRRSKAEARRKAQNARSHGYFIEGKG